jgi:hypothetical protein
MVRLITHNLLACHAKGCNTNNFPLKLTNIELALREAEFNPDFLRGFLPKIEWDALIQASREVSNTSLFIWNQRDKMLFFFWFIRWEIRRYPSSDQRCSMTIY